MFMKDSLHLMSVIHNLHCFNLQENINEYGDHPLLLNINPDTGNAHGIFLLNSNAMGRYINFLTRTS